MNIGIFGGGTWGTALAILLYNNGHDVTLWSALEHEVSALNADRRNIKNLPGAELPQGVMVTGDLEFAASSKDLIIFAIASPFVRSVAKLVTKYIGQGQIIVNVAKGIEEATLLTLSQILEEEVPQADVAVMSGPSHAEEVSRGIPTTCVVGAKTKMTAHFVQDAFMSENFRVYTSPDIIGIELGGSVKNVIALAAGVIDGLGLGDNTKAALMTRGIVEIARLGGKMGGKYETFAGLSGIGDLFVTCTSKHSRNRNAGYYIGRGYSTEDAMKEVGQVVEGIHSAKAVLALAYKYDVEMPIVEQINLVLFEGKPAKMAVSDLLLRERTQESDNHEW